MAVLLCGIKTTIEFFSGIFSLRLIYSMSLSQKVCRALENGMLSVRQLDTNHTDVRIFILKTRKRFHEKNPR